MPANKDFLSRVRIINACLGSKVKMYWSREELIEKINEKADIIIKNRSLINDIYLMRFSDQLSYYAPIRYSKKNKGYYYTDPNYSTDKLALNPQDIQALELAAATLMQYKDVAVFSEFTSSVQKVINLVNHLKKEKKQNYISFIDFEKAPYVKGNEHIDLISEAIGSKLVLNVFYQKFDDPEVSERYISPYLLKEYRNRWYLLGLEHDSAIIKTFALDRVKILEKTSFVQYRESSDFNPETYFQNTIGVSFTNSKIEEVILSFTPSTGNYLKTQHLHSTQEMLIDNSKEFRIKLNVVSNYELISTILSFGKDVKVIQPESIRTSIAKVLSESANAYM